MYEKRGNHKAYIYRMPSVKRDEKDNVGPARLNIPTSIRLTFIQFLQSPPTSKNRLIHIEKKLP